MSILTQEYIIKKSNGDKWSGEAKRNVWGKASLGRNKNVSNIANWCVRLEGCILGFVWK